MTDKEAKSKFIIEDESIEEEIITEEEKSEGLSKEDIERIQKESQETKERKKREQEMKIREREEGRAILEKNILAILKKGKVQSKYDLTNLLIKSGIENYTFRINIIENKLSPEIPLIGNVLKQLRFNEKINFSVREGGHVYYSDFNKKILKSREIKPDFDWKKYTIPKGNNEIYVILKVPGEGISVHHLLSSCYPYADFPGFKMKVDKKYENNYAFEVIDDDMTGYFDGDKLILKSKTNDTTVNKSLYRMIQIGRLLVQELIKLNLRQSELLTIINRNNSPFIPTVPVFRAIEKGAFYETKFTNVLRSIYDFPQEFKSKLVLGRFSLLSSEIHDDNFNLKSFYEFIEKTFNFQTKAFVSNAILKDWIINPSKAKNYVKVDDELEKLVEEYLQDIDTDRLIQEKLEISMEKSEFIRDITTNLLLTLIGLTFIAQWDIMIWIILGAFFVINFYYFYNRLKRRKKIVS
ncbi:MAG: hypothetical protein EAX89_10420 [Candidatus Lokiarchaeota archaeon]|nr:hypothetical protein [Candidatus Lokiarchaeota archaeon]